VTDLERAAIELHDFVWVNTTAERLSDDWPLQIAGDDQAVTEFIRLMNGLQNAIRASGHQRIAYCAEDRRLP
jgi:hypothetical protein